MVWIIAFVDNITDKGMNVVILLCFVFKYVISFPFETSFRASKSATREQHLLVVVKN